jgi:hypothetical protein
LPEWLELVRRQVSSLKFGTVQITVHDARVTQVERVEKVRLDRPNPGSDAMKQVVHRAPPRGLVKRICRPRKRRRHTHPQTHQD